MDASPPELAEDENRVDEGKIGRPRRECRTMPPLFHFKILPVKPNCKRVSLSRCLLIKTKPKTPVLSCFYVSYAWYRTSIPYKSSPPDPIVRFCSLVILLKLFPSQVSIPIRKPYAADARWDASLSSSLSVANVVKCRSYARRKSATSMCWRKTSIAFLFWQSSQGLDAVQATDIHVPTVYRITRLTSTTSSLARSRLAA